MKPRNCQFLLWYLSLWQRLPLFFHKYKNCALLKFLFILCGHDGRFLLPLLTALKCVFFQNFLRRQKNKPVAVFLFRLRQATSFKVWKLFIFCRRGYLVCFVFLLVLFDFYSFGAIVGTLRLADMFCVVLLESRWTATSQIDVDSYLMFVSFINVFTRIRNVNCQGVYAIWHRSFYVKRAFFNELYLTLQTHFAAR